MPVQNNTTITNELREQLYERFDSMITKFYRKLYSNGKVYISHNTNYVEAFFISPDKKQYDLFVTLKYFNENMQEVYDIIKNPFLIKKEEIFCELYNFC